MRLGIVACDILEKEIEFLTKDDPDFTYREYLEFALHENPPEMKRVVVEKVNALKGQVDAIFLGYAICNSLENVTQEFEVPAVMLPGADCIDTLLGPEEYKNEKKKCPGTWFCSPGWAMEGTNGLIKELHLDSMIEEGYDPSFFLDIIFDSYERTLFIDDGIGGGQEVLRRDRAPHRMPHLQPRPHQGDDREDQGAGTQRHQRVLSRESGGASPGPYLRKSDIR